MRNFRIPSLLLLASFILVACQKEIDETTTEGGGGPGGNPVTGTSYNPLSTGSWWKWKDTASGATTTSTVINKNKTANNIVYTALLSDNGSRTDTAWAASPRPNYYLAAQGVSPNTGAPYDLVFHFLNDTASVGYSWQYNAGQGNGFTSLIKTTIIAKGLSMTVEGKNYTDVIHTKLDLSYDIFGMVMQFATYDYFTARGVGIIKVRTDINAFGTSMQTCMNLVDHKIM